MTTIGDTGTVTSFDHRDEESAYDPYRRWRELRERDTLSYSELYGGFHVVSRYDDVCAVARDAATFSSYVSTIPAKSAQREAPINYDPPSNRAYRLIINRYFSPASVAAYAPWIEQLATEIIDPLLAGDTFDAAADLGIPLTKAVILRILGIDDPPAELNQWADDLILLRDSRGAEAGRHLMEFLAGEIEKRRDSADEGLISVLIRAEYGDRPLNDEELRGMILLLLLAGLETTNSAISSCILYLLNHSDTCAMLMSRPDGWDVAMDEFVRWSSPAAGQARTVRHETSLRGCPMHADDQVYIIWASANRDEHEFPDPDTIVVDRFPNRHVGFGMGPHRCLGSHLAKFVMRTVFERVVPVLHEWRLAEGAVPKWKAAEVRGLRTLRLVRRDV